VNLRFYKYTQESKKLDNSIGNLLINNSFEDEESYNYFIENKIPIVDLSFSIDIKEIELFMESRLESKYAVACSFYFKQQKLDEIIRVGINKFMIERMTVTTEVRTDTDSETASNSCLIRELDRSSPSD
jgi:hypothetical protein